MKILWTNHALDRPGGTECVTRDFVRELTRRGHDVEIYTSRPGALADQLRQLGITIHDHPSTLGHHYDLVHGQHFLETAIALTALPETTAVFYCHGGPYRGWIETPPAHPRVSRLITTCGNLADHLARTLPYERDAIGLVGNAFDPERFCCPRVTPVHLRRAAFFHNTLTRESPEWIAAETACRTCGIEINPVGSAFGHPTTSPETLLPSYDLVFAFGRSALESIVSGCATIVLGLERCGGLVDIQDLEALERSNFTRGRRSLEVSSESLLAELENYRPDPVAELSAKVRATHPLPHVTDLLERQYHISLEAGGTSPGTGSMSASVEDARATAAIVQETWRQFSSAATAARSAERAAHRARDKQLRAEQQLAIAKGRIKTVEKVLQRGWFRRPAWRAVQRHWRDSEPPSPSELP